MARLFVCQLPAVVYRASQSDERVYISRAITNDQSKSEEKETKKKKLLGVVSSSSSSFLCFLLCWNWRRDDGGPAQHQKGKEEEEEKSGWPMSVLYMRDEGAKWKRRTRRGWMDGWPHVVGTENWHWQAIQGVFFFFLFSVGGRNEGNKKKMKTGRDRQKTPSAVGLLYSRFLFFLPLSAGGGEKKLNSITHSRDREKRKNTQTVKRSSPSPPVTASCIQPNVYRGIVVCWMSFAYVAISTIFYIPHFLFWWIFFFI